MAPEGWRDRAIRFESAATGGAVGLCMEAHDLAIAKLCAGRGKDLDFASALLAENRRSSDSMWPFSFVASCSGMLKTTAFTPMCPNEKFCAVGGFCTRKSPSQFQNTMLAPAHPMLMFRQNR